MLYGDSDIQKLVRGTARNYLADNYPWERLYALEQSGPAGLAGDDLAQLANLGWLALVAPETDGGGGLTLVEAAVVVEELGHAAVPTNVIVSNVAAHMLARTGQGESVERLARGTARYTVSQATRRRERAVPGIEFLRMEGGALHGQLPAVPFAASSEYVLGPCAVDGRESYACIPLAGAELHQARQMDSSTVSHVSFAGADGSGMRILATGGEAAALAEHADTLMTGFGLIELCGAMQRTVRMTADYISNRVQFGQPVAKFQSARHRAAEMLMYTDATRWAAYRALWEYQETGDASGLWRTKLWADKAASLLFENAHMLHGGIGVGVEYPLHLFTQILAANIVRDGTASEMSRRVVESLEVAG